MTKDQLADIRERAHWDRYMRAYEDCLTATSTRHAPWYVVPADDKDNARLFVSQIVLDALHDFDMAYPKATAERQAELRSMRELLSSPGHGTPEPEGRRRASHDAAIRSRRDCRSVARAPPT